MTRDLRILAVSLLLYGIADGLIYVFRPLYMEQLGASPLQIGTVFGIAGAVLAVSHSPVGMLSDRIGPRKLITASWALGTVSIGIMFLAPSLSLFVVGLVIYFLSAFGMSPLSSYITAARGNWPLARALTTLFAAYDLGLILGPSIGGQLAEAFGLRSLYGLAAIFSILALILVFFLRPQGSKLAERPAGYRSLLRNKPYTRFILLAALTIFGMLLGAVLIPNYLRRAHAVSISEIGVFGSLLALGGVVLNLSLGRLAALPALSIAQIAMVGSAILFWRGTSRASFGVGYALQGGYAAFRSLASSRVGTLVPPEQLGMAFGILETASSLMFLLAPPLAGLMFEVNPALPFPVSAGFVCLAAVLTFLLLPRTTKMPVSPTNERTHPEGKQ